MQTNPDSNAISVLLVDDHTLFRSGIRSLLQRHPEFNVVGEAADGFEGIKRALQQRAYAAAEQGMVVHQQHADGGGFRSRLHGSSLS